MTAPAPLPPIILASASPRRQQLLQSLELPFTIRPADIDESALLEESPRDLVARLSLEKARAIATNAPDALVIAADTVVVLDDAILTKPRDAAENLEFIQRLSGRAHNVYSGYALLLAGQESVASLETRVHFRALSSAEMQRYIATGEGSDKAGGYAIQGYGATLVEKIAGCYFNVVGLSLAQVVTMAQQLGVYLV